MGQNIIKLAEKVEKAKLAVEEALTAMAASENALLQALGHSTAVAKPRRKKADATPEHIEPETAKATD